MIEINISMIFSLNHTSVVLYIEIEKGGKLKKNFHLIFKKRMFILVSHKKSKNMRMFFDKI